MPKPTGRTVERTRLFRRKELGLQVHLLESKFTSDGKTYYQSACGRVKGRDMKRTDETVTCHACIGLIRQANLPAVEDADKDTA